MFLATYFPGLGRLRANHHRSTIDVCAHGKKGKKKREYGSGRAEVGYGRVTDETSEGPGAADYLHFGRLIGERAEESKHRLDRSSMDVSNDPRAELYLEKWSQEEEMSYSMFETLLEGGDVSSATMKEISFDEIMCDSQEGIQAAFESIVLPRRGDTMQVQQQQADQSGGRQQASSSVPQDQEMPDTRNEEIVPRNEEIVPPTYEVFHDLLEPQGTNTKDITQQQAPAFKSGQQGEAKKSSKKKQNTASAIVLASKNSLIEAKVWQCNASGVLVDAEGVTGFVPFGQLDEHHGAKVVEAQQKARISLGPKAEDAAIRRAGMNILMGSVLHVKVLKIDEDLDRVIFTEKRSRAKRSTPLTESVLGIAAAHVGSVVDAEVTNLTEFGIFVKFSLPKLDGSIIGLVYTSEISWDPREIHDIVLGDRRKAKLIHVDTSKKHVFLSFKRTKANPLLETLDSLLSSHQDGDGEAHGETNRTTVDASADVRPLEGDMEDALNIATSLKQAGFPGTRLGTRLRSKASSQTIEIYLAKAAGEGSTTVLVRKGFDVQEIVVPATDRQKIISVISTYQTENTARSFPSQ